MAAKAYQFRQMLKHEYMHVRTDWQRAAREQSARHLLAYPASRHCA
jgi:hypothetical protein